MTLEVGCMKKMCIDLVLFLNIYIFTGLYMKETCLLMRYIIVKPLTNTYSMSLIQYTIINENIKYTVGIKMVYNIMIRFNPLHTGNSYDNVY